MNNNFSYLDKSFFKSFKIMFNEFNLCKYIFTELLVSYIYKEILKYLILHASSAYLVAEVASICSKNSRNNLRHLYEKFLQGFINKSAQTYSFLKI